MSQLSRRELLKAATVFAAASPFTVSSGLAAPVSHDVVPIDPMSLVDPGFREPLKRLLKEMGEFTVSSKNLKKAREPWPTVSPTPTPTFVERSIPGARGAPDVRVFVINAAPVDRLRPAILHMHGGGFVVGTAASSISTLQQIASEHDCVIVTVDYRLAPETPFPGSLEDNYAALKWLHGSAEALGMDPTRIAVMGESAGGGHAAMLAIAARDRGEVPVAFQLLIYPMLDDRTGSTRRVPSYIGAYIWVPASNRFGWTSLLGVPAGSPVVPAGAVPARVEHLAGLPPAFIGVGSIDLFIDEDMDYAKRLINAGVPTQLCVVPGGYHGFDGIASGANASKQFRRTWNAALAKAFAENTSA